MQVSRRAFLSAVGFGFMPIPRPLPQQGNLCWLYAVAECFRASGLPFDIPAVYRAVEGRDLVLPGLPGGVGQAKQAVQAGAILAGAAVEWAAPPRDLATLDQLVRDGWYVWVAVDLAAFGIGGTDLHALLATGLGQDILGFPTVSVVSSTAGEIGSLTVPLWQFHLAVLTTANGPQAFAFKLRPSA